MTRKHALIELRDKVKAGDELDGLTVSRAFPAWKPLQKWSLMNLLEWACDADDIRAMGAAKVLHEAVLHKAAWVSLSYSSRYADQCSAEISHATVTCRIKSYIHASVWQLGTLEALIAQEPDT